MEYIFPESKGISSKKIEEYIRILEENKLNTHNVLISRGNTIIFEHYWKPFHKNFYHRMYSASKSFVSLAVGFLWQEGKIDLDESISSYFPEESAIAKDKELCEQTVRHMLMMSTAKTRRWWFAVKPEDRVKDYFENDIPEVRPSGSIYEYDSNGSFVLCALVERITGKKMMDYLREKLFDKIDVSKDAYCLECPGGHSWGDSGILCTARDLWKTARFVLNKGMWNNEQLLSAEYLERATTKQIDNNPWGICGPNTWGYGYQFWMTYQNSFFFNGMGCQYAVCVPDKDIILVYNGDNQGNQFAMQIIIDNFFRLIVNECSDAPLEENFNDYKQLWSYLDTLELSAITGEKYNSLEKRINGVVFEMDNNPMGIQHVKFEFSDDEGILYYKNAQGEKELHFGRCKNVFGLFPEEGFADEIGTVLVPGNKYKCAVSAGWVEPQKLHIKVQIIDKYFGILNIVVGFREEGLVINMNKSAEDFLNSYQGYAVGYISHD